MTIRTRSQRIRTTPFTGVKKSARSSFRRSEECISTYCSLERKFEMRACGAYQAEPSVLPQLQSNELAICSVDDVKLEGYNTFSFDSYRLHRGVGDDDDILEIIVRRSCGCERQTVGDRVIRVSDPFILCDLPGGKDILDADGRYNEIELENMMEWSLFNDLIYTIMNVDPTGDVVSVKPVYF